MRSNRVLSRMLIAACLAGAGLVAAPVFSGPAACVFAQNDNSQLVTEVQKRLRNKNFKNITVQSNGNGNIVLSGEVDLYGYKVSAVKNAKKVRGVHDVQDNITVGGATVPDNVLQQKLLSRIEVDRVGFGQAFDAIGVEVRNGVVTLGGHAVGPVAKQSAISLTEYTPGVKGINDQISVDPVSPMDNGIRMRTFRAIYGYPPLRRYAMVPSRPIRISVQNGHVTLYGVVDSQMDKQLVYTRAMQVPGVFSVTNDLQVANQPNEKK